MASPSHLRLFFALWPDGLQRAALVDVTAPLLPASGRRVPPGNLHVTLAFLGKVEASRIAYLEAVVDPLGWSRFDIAFDRTAYWPKARIVCLEASRPPEALTVAVFQLHEALRSAGFPIEHRTFRPHVTLARNVEPSKAATPKFEISPPIQWTARGIALIESTQAHGGSVYSVLRQWP